MHVTIEISPRHIHLSREHLELLFGYGYTLTPRKTLPQFSQTICAEQLTVIGPRGSMRADIVAPLREQTQVELAMSDAAALGIRAPIRVGGDLAGSGSCMLVGPCGEVELAEGVIVAKRHLHLTPEDAAALGVRQGQAVRVAVQTEERSLVFGDVVARVSPDSVTCCHLDTDEANAAGITDDWEGEILL